MLLAIGSDKSGYTLKEAVKAYLTEQGHEVQDMGLIDPDGFMPYYTVASNVAGKVSGGEFEKAVLICGTGAGMCIVANKFKGVYAVVAEGSYTARMAAVVNQANILTMGGWAIAPQQAIDMVDRWLKAGFTEGFPEDRQQFLRNAFDEVRKIENDHFK